MSSAAELTLSVPARASGIIRYRQDRFDAVIVFSQVSSFGRLPRPYVA
ncbi:hypothetical protein [Bradyrhizobium sp. JR3.5]